jgi:dUTP pyrophosphatase
MTTYVKLLSDKAKLPTKGSEYAAGHDLYAAHGAVLQPGECVKISTDIAIQLPSGTFGGIFARSGLATKKGLRPINCVGK